MSPIQCLRTSTSASPSSSSSGTSATSTGADDDPVCVIMVGVVPVLPVFHHVGESLDFPTKCNCTTLHNLIDLNTQQSVLMDNKHPCHAFRFLTGFLFWNRADALPLFEMRKKLIALSSTSTSTIASKNYHAYAYEALFLTSSLAQVSKYANSTFQSITYRENVFSFCKTVSGGYCNVLSLAIYDLNFKGHTISSTYYQLDYGACRNSMTPNVTEW
jgi:hypothetical protein